MLDQIIADIVREKRGVEAGAVEELRLKQNGKFSVPERVSDALQPVSAPSWFQKRLMADLMHRAQTQCGRPTTSVWQEKRTEIIIGATVGSVLSAVGLAYYIYSRMPSHDRNVA